MGQYLIKRGSIQRMNKKQLLSNVKRQIEENGIIAFNYSNGCNCCVVGYALQEMGMSMDELKKLPKINVSSIYSEETPDEYYSDSRYFTEWTKAHHLLINSGITKNEWDTLQTTNDWCSVDILHKELDKMIVLSGENE
jgi:hypothetical protein